jgi:hypothetical protein
MKNAIALFISILTFSCLAQNLDTYNKSSWKHPVFKKYKFIAGFDNRNSLIEQNSTSFMGVRAGVEINRKGRVGAGFYFTNKGVYVQNQIWDRFPDQLFNSRTNFYYFSVFGEYIALRKIRWEISFPSHIGIGWANERFYNVSQSKFVGKEKNIISLVELSALVSFRTCRWFGVGLGFGYRAIINRNELLRNSYNAPISMFRLKFYVNELYYLFKYKTEKKKQK